MSPKPGTALRRDRAAYARWEKEQWAADKVARKAHDRPKARREPPRPLLPAVPLHPTEGSRDEVVRALEAARAKAHARGGGRAARKARGWG